MRSRQLIAPGPTSPLTSPLACQLPRDPRDGPLRFPEQAAVDQGTRSAGGGTCFSAPQTSHGHGLHPDWSSGQPLIWLHSKSNSQSKQENQEMETTLLPGLPESVVLGPTPPMEGVRIKLPHRLHHWPVPVPAHLWIPAPGPSCIGRGSVFPPRSSLYQPVTGKLGFCRLQT